MFTDQKIASEYAATIIRPSTSTVKDLDPELMLIAENQARASHEGWMSGKLAQGYTYGSVTNDDPSNGPLTNPLLVPYDELDEETKLSNIANAVAVLRIMRDKGCTFVNFTQIILYPLAKQIHDEWSREKIKAGWKWGPITDKANKIHRDLVPFEVLASDSDLNGDIAYDVDTARQIIIKMISDNDVFPIIQNLAQFKLEESA